MWLERRDLVADGAKESKARLGVVSEVREPHTHLRKAAREEWNVL